MSHSFWDKKKFLVSAGLIVFLAGLAVYAYLGYYNRYWADDWCYNADFRKLGFWGTIEGYTYITTYASNRFSLTLFSGLFHYGGVFGIQLLTWLVILFWVWGLYRLLKNINTVSGLGLSGVHMLLAVSVIVYYSISLAPHLYQSLYWRSGLLPYTAPVIFSIWVFASITSRAVHDDHGRSLAVLAGFLSFIGGGFSEAGNATLTAMLIAFVFLCVAFKRRKWARDVLPIAVAALCASIFAMVILIASPTTIYRVGLYEGTASFIQFPRELVHQTGEFIMASVRDAPLTHLVIFGTLWLVGVISVSSAHKHIELKTWFCVVSLIMVSAFLFIAASYAPSMYIEQGPPAARTRIIAQFIFVLGHGLTAFISGFLVGQYLQWRRLAWMIPAMLLLCYAYSINSIMLSAEKIPLYAGRAAVWDERDMQIRQSRAQGILEVNVRGIDGLPVDGIRDFKDKPGSGFWVNRCAARYYGVDAIYATLP